MALTLGMGYFAPVVVVTGTRSKLCSSSLFNLLSTMVSKRRLSKKGYYGRCIDLLEFEYQVPA